eukprot:1194402-Alexandrium_andersonii.AAC.1
MNASTSFLAGERLASGDINAILETGHLGLWIVRRHWRAAVARPRGRCCHVPHFRIPLISLIPTYIVRKTFDF